MDIRESITPKPSASAGEILPSGIGIFVLSMSLSISLSNHMFIAPDAPAPEKYKKSIERKERGVTQTEIKSYHTMM